MFFSLSMVFLSQMVNQLLSAQTAATALTACAMLLRPVRQSRFGRIILLSLMFAVGAIAARQWNNLWLMVALVFPPLMVALTEAGAWTSWATLGATCLIQNAGVLLLSSACVVLRSQSLFGWLIGGMIWMAQLCWILMTGATTFDVFNVLGRRRFPQRERLLSTPEPAHWPGVCIQVPAHNEPPEVLAQTIKQLMQQDYLGRWMVQVIDNNTPDPRTWLPIKQLCHQLSDRVQFLHLENWPGFKSGALNEGMRHLPAWVEMVAVIDADCLVDPLFLRATARHFVDEEVPFVQTPQQYLVGHPLAYCHALKYLYESVIGLFLSSRREFNGIACAGTMVLIRRRCLQAIGGWDEDCIAEDAELSVRLLGRGWRGIYDHRSYARGLLALDFASLKKQRFRWACGAMHVLKKHWRTLLGLPGKEGSRLTWCQRLCFFGYGAQYVLELVSTIFAFLLFANAILACLGQPVGLEAVQEMHAVALVLFLLFFLRTFWAIRASTGCSRAQAAGAMLCMLSLSFITAYACLSGLLHRKGIFLRTPKHKQQYRWPHALRGSWQELLLASLFLGGAILVWTCHLHAPMTALLLVLQACVYTTAVLWAFAAEGVWLRSGRPSGTRENKHRAQRGLDGTQTTMQVGGERREAKEARGLWTSALFTLPPLETVGEQFEHLCWWLSVQERAVRPSPPTASVSKRNRQISATAPARLDRQSRQMPAYQTTLFTSALP